MDARHTLEPKHAHVEVDHGVCVRVMVPGRMIIVPWSSVKQIVYDTSAPDGTK